MKITLFAAAVAASATFASAQTRISCVGDSITAGVCSKTTHGYPAVLQTLLGNGYTVGNFGNSGKTMLKKGLCGPPAGGDCAYWDTPTYPAAMASTPDIVTIMLGTNDAKEFNWFNASTGNYTADYLDMVARFKALPTKPKVYLMIPPPLYPPYPYAMNSSVINTVFPALIPSIAAAAGADGVIDIFDALGGVNLTQPGITCDGCHPVDKGYNEIAATMAAVLKAAAVDGSLAPTTIVGGVPVYRPSAVQLSAAELVLIEGDAAAAPEEAAEVARVPQKKAAEAGLRSSKHKARAGKVHGKKQHA